MSPSVTEEEVFSLARVMTLKFGFANVYYGGAKAGIRIRETLSASERRVILESFGRALKGIIGPGFYHPGEDIGTGQEEVALVLQAAGVTKIESSKAGSGYYTALSVVTGAEVLCRHVRILLPKATATLEGFGKVGESVARLLREKEVTILAVSTKAGAVYDPNGIKLQGLLDLKKQYGDECVLHYRDGKQISLEGMVTLDSDILILAGKPEVVHARNCGEVKARVIVPGGNLAITREAEDRLARQGVFVFPDFVVNCGGILGLTWNGMGLTDLSIQRLMEEELGEKLVNLLALSKGHPGRLREVAETVASQNFQRMQKELARGALRPMAKFLHAFQAGPAQWVHLKFLRMLANRERASQRARVAYAKALFWLDKGLYHRWAD